jgi:hypothetical protein
MDKIQNHEKGHFDGVNPAVRVHALLGNHEPARTLAIREAQSLTDKLAP